MTTSEDEESPLSLQTRTSSFPGEDSIQALQPKEDTPATIKALSTKNRKAPVTVREAPKGMATQAKYWTFLSKKYKVKWPSPQGGWKHKTYE